MPSCVKTACSPSFYGLIHNREESIGIADQRNQRVDPITGKTVGIGRFLWIVHNGDLIVMEPSAASEVLLEFNFTALDKKSFTIPVYRYLGDDGDPPTHLRGASRGKMMTTLGLIQPAKLSETKLVYKVPISFAGIDLNALYTFSGLHGLYYRAIVCFKAIWSGQAIAIEVTWNGMKIASSSPEQVTL